jgi:hypothetical protein
LRAAIGGSGGHPVPELLRSRQMTVATYPVPIADLRDIRLLKGVFFDDARRVITRSRPDHRRSRSELGQGRYGLRLAVDNSARRGRDGMADEFGPARNQNG